MQHLTSREFQWKTFSWQQRHWSLLPLQNQLDTEKTDRSHWSWPTSSHLMLNGTSWIGIAASMCSCECVCVCVSHKDQTTDPISHLLALSKGCLLPAERMRWTKVTLMRWSSNVDSNNLTKNVYIYRCCTLMSLCILPVSCRWYKPCRKTQNVNRCVKYSVILYLQFDRHFNR